MPSADPENTVPPCLSTFGGFTLTAAPPPTAEPSRHGPTPASTGVATPATATTANAAVPVARRRARTARARPMTVSTGAAGPTAGRVRH
ncbi:hypothetical protein ACFQ9X_37495 [Catenulispora yoronensis]